MTSNFYLASNHIDKTMGTVWSCPLTSGATEQMAKSNPQSEISGSFMQWIYDLAPLHVRQWYCQMAYTVRYVFYSFLGIFVNREFILKNSFIALQEVLLFINHFITNTFRIPVKFPMFLVSWISFDIVHGIIASIYLIAIPFVSLLVGRKIYKTFFQRFVLGT